MANFLMLPRFYNVWWPDPNNSASFFFVELMAVLPEPCKCCGEVKDSKRAYHVAVVSDDGAYVGKVAV